MGMKLAERLLNAMEFIEMDVQMDFVILKW